MIPNFTARLRGAPEVRKSQRQQMNSLCTRESLSRTRRDNVRAGRTHVPCAESGTAALPQRGKTAALPPSWYGHCASACRKRGAKWENNRSSAATSTAAFSA